MDLNDRIPISNSCAIECILLTFRLHYIMGYRVKYALKSYVLSDSWYSHTGIAKLLEIKRRKATDITFKKAAGLP